MGRAYRIALGAQDRYEGLQTAIAVVPPRFASIIHSQAQGESARVLQEEILSLLNKGAICVVPPAQSQSGFLLQVFSGSQTGGKRYSPYPGPAGSEQIPQEIQISDADTRIPAAFSKTGRFSLRPWI